MKYLPKTIVSSLLLSMLFSLSSAAYGQENVPAHNVVDLNTATSAELESLPGIGPSKAQAIIDFRSKNKFKKVDDIMKVKGIGRKSFLKLKPYLKVSGEADKK